jgi:hypothetical protein
MESSVSQRSYLKRRSEIMAKDLNYLNEKIKKKKTLAEQNGSLKK